MDKLVEYNYKSLINAPDEFFYKILLNNECLNKYQRGSSRSEAHIEDIINTSLGNVLITTAVESNNNSEPFENILKDIFEIDPYFRLLDPDLQKVVNGSIANWKKQFTNGNPLQYKIRDIIRAHKYLPICIENCKKQNIEDCYDTLRTNGFLQKNTTSKANFMKAFSPINYYEYKLEEIYRGKKNERNQTIKIDFPSQKEVIWTNTLKGSLAYFANGVKDKVYQIQEHHYYQVFNDMVQLEKYPNFELKKNTSPSEDPCVTYLLDQALNELSDRA